MFKLVVLSCVVAVGSAIAIAPLGWTGAGAGAAGWAGQGLAAPLGTRGVVAAPVLGAYNYRGPLSLAPGQPANILAADGRPLDTLSVNLDRAAHYTARAVDGAHVLHKRSAVLATGPVAWGHGAGLAVPAHLGVPVAAPLITPLGASVVGGPGVGALGQASWGVAASWGAQG